MTPPMPVARPKHFLPKGTALVAPPTRLKVFGSLLLALALNLSPWVDEVRWLVPDFALMVLLYWAIRAPWLAGLGVAFLLGLVADIDRGLHMGLSSLAYCSATFLVLTLQRRLENFDALRQGLQLAPMLMGKEVLVLLMGFWFGHHGIDWRWLAAGVTSALLWPALAWLLDVLTGHAVRPQAD